MTRLNIQKVFLQLLPSCLCAALCAACSGQYSAKGIAGGQTPIPADGAPKRVRQTKCPDLKTAPAVFGVTVTDPSQYEAAVAKLSTLAARDETVPLVVRLVFSPIKEKDAGKFDEELGEYQRQARELRARVRDGCGLYVMGTIADSFEMHFYLPDKTDPKWPEGYANYEKWTERLVRTMGDLVDIWEVGNEVNGEWYGWKDKKYKDSDEDEGAPPKPKWQERRRVKRGRIKHELRVAFDKVRSLRPRGMTAVTLLYNDDGVNHCAEFPEYKMNDWAGEYLTPDLREKVDFVFLSYYENTQDCPMVTRDPDKLLKVLVSLRNNIFKGDHTAFGFGEINYKQTCYRKDKPDEEIEDSARADNAACQAGQKDYVERYYQTLDRQLAAAVTGYRPEGDAKAIKFVGGYFYWYFLQDLVQTKDQSAWEALLRSREGFRKEIK